MNIFSEVSALKEKGTTDQDVIDMLVLKGAEEKNIRSELQEYYNKKNATVYLSGNAKSNGKNTNMLLLIIVILLLVMALFLGFIIFNR